MKFLGKYQFDFSTSYVVFSAIGSYFHVLDGNQEQWAYLSVSINISIAVIKYYGKAT